MINRDSMNIWLRYELHYPRLIFQEDHFLLFVPYTFVYKYWELSFILNFFFFKPPPPEKNHRTYATPDTNTVYIEY